jgi:hypothetical protein
MTEKPFLRPVPLPGASVSRHQQGNEIPTIQRGNIPAQQKAQHQAALSSDIEHNRQNSPQPQATSISLLSTPCHLVYNRPVGAAGFEPATSSLSGMRSDQLSYAPSTAYFTVRAAWASSGVIADSSPSFGAQPDVRRADDNGYVGWPVFSGTEGAPRTPPSFFGASKEVVNRPARGGLQWADRTLE